MEERINLKTAKKLSLLKWEYLAETGADYIQDSPNYWKLEDLLAGCGFCEYQSQFVSMITGSICKGCPLNTQNRESEEPANNCCGGLFNEWYKCKTVDGRKTIAKKILELIKSVKV